MPLIIIRPHYLDIVGGQKRTQDVVAGAALLGVFEYWTALRKEKSRRRSRSRPGWEWIAKSLEQLSEVLLGMFGTKTVRAALKLLAARRRIPIRENPMLKVDRKHQYHFEISNVRAEIAQWIACQQTQDGRTAHLAEMPTDKASLPNGEAHLPIEASKVPGASPKTPSQILTEFSIEHYEHNLSSNSLVADATEGAISYKGTICLDDPRPVTAQPTVPNADPSTPIPQFPPSEAMGVPAGYVLRYAGGSGKTAHLVHVDATETACGKPTALLLDTPKPGRGYSVCPQCASRLRSTERQPSIDQRIKDAIAENLQGIPITMATAYTGVLANIAINVWKRKLGRALSLSEYDGAARSIAPFVADFPANNPTLKLPTTQTAFEDYFTKFVARANAAPTSNGVQKRANDDNSTPTAEPDRYRKHSSVFSLSPKSDAPCQWCAGSENPGHLLPDHGRRAIVPVSGYAALPAFDPRAQWMKQQGILGMDEFQHQHPEAEHLRYQTCRCIMDDGTIICWHSVKCRRASAASRFMISGTLPPALKAGKEVAITIATMLCESDTVTNEETGEVKFGAVFAGELGLGKSVLAAQPVIERAKRGKPRSGYGGAT